MKNLILTLTLIFALCLSSAHAQKVIDDPKHGISLASYLDLTKIELSDSATVMSFLVNFRPGNWISIPKETFLLNPEDGEKLFIVGSEGIPFNEQYWMPDSGQVAFKVIFPPVNKNWERVDYGEDNEGGNWAIYDIQLKPNLLSSVVPTELKGNWYNSKSGDWELGLQDTLAIYKNQVWKYKDGDFSDTNGHVTLSGKDREVRLYLRSDEKGTILAGEDSENLRMYANADLVSSMTVTMDSLLYSLPVFENDSATFSGFIAGYSPRVGFKTFTIYVNDLLTGEQASKTIRVSENGEFSIKIPYYYPHSVYVRSPFAGGEVLLEPGKELFVMYDGPNVLFMGELGGINRALRNVQDIGNFNYGRMREMILDMTPQDYKIFFTEERDNALQTLNKYESEHGLQPKVRQIKDLELAYSYADYLLSYEMNFNFAYREKHEIPRSQRELPIEIENPSHEYYDFLTNDFVNNPMAVITNAYDPFVNRLKYSSILRDNQHIVLTTSDIADELIKSGNILSPEEAQLIEKMEAFDASEAKKEIDAFNKKYADRIQGFHSKYSEDLKDLTENSKGLGVTLTMMADHLKIKGVEITDEEQEMVEAFIVFNQSPWMSESQNFYKENGETISKFHSDHNDFTNKLFAGLRSNVRNQLLEDTLGIESGLIVDVMNAQDFLGSIASQMIPASNDEVDNFKKKISTPFIAAYAESVNEQIIAKIEANKNKTGYSKNDVPKTEADQLFEAMMAKFKGKVVYVDFWASWCGPCRSGIERIKPLKEELKDEELVFVYITNQSTPEKTWENMIPDIKGEHFRVSSDEWNYLSEKFNVSGIPHYVLVDKSGQVVQPNMGHYGNDMLKNILLEHIKK